LVKLYYLLSLAAAAAPLALWSQGSPPLKKEGSYWVRRTVNSASCKPNGRLQVNTRGSVTVRGTDKTMITYTLTQKARARSAEDAARALGDVYYTARSKGDLTTLVVLSEERPGLSSHLDIAVPRSLEEAIIETQSGDVDAADLDGMVRATTAFGRILLDRLSAAAVARTGGGEIRVGRVAGNLRAWSSGGSVSVENAGGETWVETAGGEILIREAAGPVFATTEGGNINVWKALQAVQARSASGLIEVIEAGGLVTAETKAGSIQVGSSKGVRCQSAQGTIRVKAVSGPLRCATAAGSILAEFAGGVRPEESFLTAGRGDITVLIPSNFKVSVKARNDSPELVGRIVSDFPQVRVKTLGFEPTRPAVAEGAINGGGPLLRINAAGGTIFLRRQK
jgi:DUF4097 and DUF4098 domain-containing protein YvlB